MLERRYRAGSLSKEISMVAWLKVSKFKQLATLGLKAIVSETLFQGTYLKVWVTIISTSLILQKI
jgi:hypothetical protein